MKERVTTVNGVAYDIDHTMRTFRRIPGPVASPRDAITSDQRFHSVHIGERVTFQMTDGRVIRTADVLKREETS